MDTKPIVLFVNHLQHNCGVYQFFNRMTKPVVDSSDTYYYIETNHEWEHDYWINQLNPDIVVYNFYFSGATMPWLTTSKIASQKYRFKQICLFHEGNIDDKGFDLILHQNPVNLDTRYHNLPRPIPEYHKLRKCINELPTIGTFGFGLGGKSFHRIVEQANKEFNKAVIRMNIPFAHFGDANGDGARWWANHSRSLAKEGIEVRITHDLLPEPQLLDFLAENDINCFFYDDNIGRGISGTLDYALAVHKPIAITKSWQFQHMWNDTMILEADNGIKEILAAGTQHLQKYHDKWNNQTLIASFNEAFSKVRNND